MKVIERAFVICCAVVAGASTVGAQGRWDDTAAQDRRAESLKSRPLPIDAAQLYNESVAAEQELQFLSEQPRSKRISELQEQYVEDLAKAIPQAAKTDCAKPEQVTALRDVFHNGRPGDEALWSMTALDDNAQTSGFILNSNAATCQTFKTWTASREAQTFVSTQKLNIAKWQRDVVDKESASREQLKAALQSWSGRLKKALDEAKQNQKPQDEIASNLLKYLMALAGFGILMLLAIRLYDTRQQAQWIRSGQVIQTMTVIVLLFAILALGLSNKLKEDILGTLLGGVAGYVLSSGVRSGTNAVRRKRIATRGPGPNDKSDKDTADDDKPEPPTRAEPNPDQTKQV